MRGSGCDGGAKAGWLLPNVQVLSADLRHDCKGLRRDWAAHRMAMKKAKERRGSGPFGRVRARDYSAAMP